MNIQGGQTPSDEELMSAELEAAFCTGFGIDGTIPPLSINELPQEIAEMHAEEEAWWGNQKFVESELVVELPFWLMVENGTFYVPHESAHINVRVIGDFVELYHGPSYLNSHANAAFVGSESELRQLDLKKTIPGECPIFRSMKTVVVFTAKAAEDAILAWDARDSVVATDRPAMRRINRAMQYFDALAFAHIPFVNRLITSYRSTSLDPCAFEVSEWDVPVWYLRSGGSCVRICLMPYWNNDTSPSVRSGVGKSQYCTTTQQELAAQISDDVSPGKLELLDALSLSYRGRYEDAVRSAVTAIEVALEAAVRDELSRGGLSASEIDARLEQTRNSFFERFEEYQLLSKRKVPGPVLSVIPYINGVRLREELESVRTLRHKIVHEGRRIAISERGPMLRAVETMTWLYDWIAKNDPHGPSSTRNYSFFAMLRGHRMYGFDYTPTGVVVRSRGSYESGQAIPTADELLWQQYIGSIGIVRSDVELFARMTFVHFGIACGEAPPQDPATAIRQPRFLVSDGNQKSIVFCIDVDGYISVEAVNEVAASVLAYRLTANEVWNCICIVNHQRHLAPITREVNAAIPSEVESIAVACGITLSTTIDIALLARGMLEYSWERSALQAVFFLKGRQGIHPPCYKKIGILNQIYPRVSVISVDIDNGASLKVGDTIGLRLRDRYAEEVVKSLEHARTPCTEAQGPMRVGIRTTLSKSDLRGVRDVYLRVPSISNEPVG